MKLKQLFTKNLFILLLCLGFFPPIQTENKQSISPEHNSLTIYSDMPDDLIEY